MEMELPRDLRLEYASWSASAPARWDDVLGVATFNGSRLGSSDGRLPIAHVDTPVLAGSRNVCEIWRADRGVESGRFEDVLYRCTSDVLFGCATVTENEAAPRNAEERHTPLHCATERAYRSILDTLKATGYPHLVRVWNYLPEINRYTQDTERYRQFNSARQAAFRDRGWPIHTAPAACALGTRPGAPLVIYFIAGRSAPRFIENPRQVSAYHYPPEYGPRSPLFSRATLVQKPHGIDLFISGTASIVGHRTLHAGDVLAQTRETLTNIEAVLAEASRVVGAGELPAEALSYKTYVRHPRDLELIRSEVAARLGAAPVLYLQADICREDLLVEIEASGSYPVRLE